MGMIDGDPIELVRCPSCETDMTKTQFQRLKALGDEVCPFCRKAKFEDFEGVVDGEGDAGGEVQGDDNEPVRS